jgi:MoxR-like ATPase
VPEELFGPLSISALEQDRYERQTRGFLPQASIAFIDEVFKANSAILNALLTLLNEREFDNGAVRERCPLISVIGATNEVPQDEVADAFFDRFLVRLPVGPVTGRLPAAAPSRSSRSSRGGRHRAGRSRRFRGSARFTAGGGRPPPAELRAWLAAERLRFDRRW